MSGEPALWMRCSCPRREKRIRVNPDRRPRNGEPIMREDFLQPDGTPLPEDEYIIRPCATCGLYDPAWPDANDLIEEGM